MKRNLISILSAGFFWALLFYSTAIRAQAPDGSWEKIGTINFTALARQSPSTVTAATSHGYIYYSHDFGLTWKRYMVNDTADLVDLAWADSLHGAAIEEFNNVFLTSDGGQTWMRSEVPIESLTTPVDPLTKLSYPSADTLYVCDFLGRILRTTDRGMDWTSYQTSAMYGLTAIHFLDAKTGFAGGAGTDSSFFKTTDAGVHWVCQFLPVAADSLGALCLDFRGRDTGIIGAWGYYWVTTNNGGTWNFHSVPLNAHGPLYSLSLMNDSEFFGFGVASQYYYSHDLGATMSSDLLSEDARVASLLSAYNGSQTINGTLYDQKYGGIVMGTDGIILRSQNGYTWAISNECAFNGGTAQNFGDTILLCGSYLVKSTNAGKTWNSDEIWFVDYSEDGILDTITNWQVGGARFITPDSGLVFLSRGVTVGTTDGGLSWDSVGRNPGFGKIAWHGLAGCGEDGSGMNIGVTTDGGLTWIGSKIPKDKSSPFPNAFPYGSALSDPFVLDSQNSYVLCVYVDIDTTGGHNTYYGHTDLLRTTDGGSTWFPETSLPTVNAHSIVFRTRTLGYLGGDTGKYYRTEDGGQHWETFQLPTNNPIDNFEFLNDTLGFVSGSSHDGDHHLNFFTTNGGTSWVPDTARFPTYDGGGYPLSSHVFLNSRTLFAMDGGNLFIRSWPPGNPHARVENNLGWNLGTFLWVENYPNPAANYFHCSLSGMWSNPGALLSAQLYDLLGRQVMDLSDLAKRGNNGNTSDFDVDVSSLPAGVYMVRYTLGGYSSGRPVVIIH